jgi:xylulokinase
MTGTAVLTVDLGGTSMRAGLFDRRGKLLALQSRPVPGAEGSNGTDEQNPEEWWKLLCRLTRDLLADKGVKGVKLDGIAITGVTRSQVFLASNGRVVRPAIMWRDARAVAEAAVLREAVAASGVAPELADQSPISAYHPIARLLWVKAHEPKLLDRTHRVLQPKDFLNYRLTGKAGGDLLSSASLTDRNRHGPAAGGAVAALFARLGLNPQLVPELAEPETVLGPVQKKLPAPFDKLAGVPVFVSTMDTWCATLGIGANQAGQAYDIAGTSEVVGLITKKQAAVPGLVTIPWGDGLTHIGGPSQAGADCLAWFAEAVAGDGSAPAIAALMAGLPRADRHPLGPIFLPYLAGERTPLWDPDARGVFFGLDRAHGQADLLGAVLEGVAFSNRHVLELAEHAAGAQAAAIRIAGGGARFDLWCQIKADVTGREIVRTEMEEAGLFGAALMVLHGQKRFKSRAEAQKALVKIARRFKPDPKRHAAYSLIYPLYLDLTRDLSGRFRSLAKLRRDPIFATRSKR